MTSQGSILLGLGSSGVNCVNFVNFVYVLLCGSGR
jgi:hypothetical protein